MLTESSTTLATPFALAWPLLCTDLLHGHSSLRADSLVIILLVLSELDNAWYQEWDEGAGPEL